MWKDKACPKDSISVMKMTEVMITWLNTVHNFQFHLHCMYITAMKVMILLTCPSLPGVCLILC